MVKHAKQSSKNVSSLQTDKTQRSLIHKKTNQKMSYFIASPDTEADIAASAKITFRNRELSRAHSNCR